MRLVRQTRRQANARHPMWKRRVSGTAFDIRTLNPFRFSSEYADDALGLVYYNYRHYEPVTGRWLSRDLIEEWGGVNMYGFSGDSIVWYDVLGMAVRKRKGKPEIKCAKDTVGAKRSNVDVALVPDSLTPGELDYDLKIVMAALLFLDIPLAGASNASDIAIANIPGLPKGADVAEIVMRNYKRLKKLSGRDGRFKVWTKTLCQECRCQSGLLVFLGLSEPTYSWVTYDESEWVLCDIQETAWGKDARRSRSGKVTRDGTLKEYLLSPHDKKTIREQCIKKAMGMCD